MLESWSINAYRELVPKGLVNMKLLLPYQAVADSVV
jgi:hypothetical protein